MSSRITRHKARAALLAAAVLWLCGPRAPWPALAQPGGNGTVLRVLPASGTYPTNSTLTVSVRLENVTDLYGADVALAFDPARLRVLDADPNWPGVQVTPHSELLQPTLLQAREADNAAGTIHFAASQAKPDLPASGSGVLFSFDVLLLTAGEAALVFDSQLLSTVNADVIPAASEDAAYTVTEALNLYLPVLLRVAPVEGAAP